MTRELHGFGVGLRRSFADALLETVRPPDFIELTPENWAFFGGRRRQMLEANAERFPSTSHSVSLSIGGLEPLDAPLIDSLAQLVRRHRMTFFSDHLCYSSVAGSPVHDLLPLPFTAEVVEHVARRVAEAQERVEAPLALENATFYSHMPGAQMDEATFLGAVLERSGCRLLLDVNNVYVNSLNHHFEPRAFIDRMPLDRVVEIHVAGHTAMDGVVIDTHIGPIIDPVWDLYRYTIARAGRPIPTLVEWDQEIPELDGVLDEVDRARAHSARALGEPP